MNFVFDTNVLLSAILKPNSLPQKAIEKAIIAGNIFFSTETKEEFIEVVAREKFEQYIPKLERIEAANRILSNANLTEVSTEGSIACRDKKDIKFLQLALEIEANCMISGDIHLIELHPFQGIPIMNPTDFLAWISNKEV